MSECQRVATPRQNQKRPLIRLIRRAVCTRFFTAADESEVGSPAGPPPPPVRNVENNPKTPTTENNSPMPDTKNGTIEGSKSFMRRIT
jgi:hypothetical protein